MEPLIYFKGIFPGQYAIVAPVFILVVDAARRLAELEVGLPVADTTPQGLVSEDDVRAYATRDAVYRLHQQRFRAAVLSAYATRCAVCSLRERDLLDASHIIADGEPEGAATVTNGIALCTIHHRAYDRNLMGIDPDGQVHISRRLLEEHDGPMLRGGLQAFHGASILRPRRVEEHPDPDRLRARFGVFLQAA
jgi:putative restriction endonuclease